jgi:hypothetical protein
VISRNFPRLGLNLGVLILGYFLVRGATYFRQVDASKDGRAENFAQEVLSAAPENALIFAKGDQAVFAMWYFHLALRQRPDLVVIATDLMYFDWYQETLRVAYPALKLPGPFPWPETVAQANPANPVCYIEYVEQVVIDCELPEYSD